MKKVIITIGLILLFWAVQFYSMLSYATYKFGYIPQYGLDADWNTWNKQTYSLFNVMLSSVCLILIPAWVLLWVDCLINKRRFNIKEKYLNIGSIISIITFIIAHSLMKNYIGWVND